MIPKKILEIKDVPINPLPFPYPDAQHFQQVVPSIQIPDDLLSAPDSFQSHYHIVESLTSVT